MSKQSVNDETHACYYHHYQFVQSVTLLESYFLILYCTQMKDLMVKIEFGGKDHLT